MMEHYEVVSPLGEPVIESRRVGRYFDTLNGKTVGEIWNEEMRGDLTFPIIREMLSKRYPDVKVIPFTELPSSILNVQSPEEMTKRLEAVRNALIEKGCDAVITAQGA